MAQATTSAMTPEQALRTVASVRDYREHLTARAAGIVWMVWGLALAILASGDIVGLVATDEQSFPGDEGWSVSWAGWLPILAPLAGLAAGAVATNAVWKAHALQGGARHRAWIAWVGIIGLVAAGMAVGFVSVELAARLTDPTGGGSTYIVIMPLMAAVGAGAITILQRRRVSPWPGAVAATALVAYEFLLPVLAGGPSLEARILHAVQASMFGILAVFVATGLWYYKRG